MMQRTVMALDEFGPERGMTQCPQKRHARAMLVTADETTGSDIAGTVVFLTGLTAVIIFMFGYRMQRMHRARVDLQATKKSIPLLRKGFWGSLWAVIKIGFIVFLFAFAMIAWWLRGDHRSADANPGPSPSSTTTSHRR